ncbi:hypothetical protein RSJ42_08700 [Methanosarcina hadiensis]|uniref:hypothetical protein n=1 Tax=Methanosarcina hadiensis TaxID=3078083 RepID=UPI00397750CF
MQLESTKRKNQEYFAAWDKKIENTWMRLLSDMAKPFIIFIILNIFTIAILVKLSIYNFNF